MRYRLLTCLIIIAVGSSLFGCSHENSRVDEKVKIAQVQEAVFELSDNIRDVEIEMSSLHQIQVYVYSDSIEMSEDELIVKVEEIADEFDQNEDDEYIVDVEDIRVLIEQRR